MLNYEKLMSQNPTSLGQHTNSMNQVVEFYEHPTLGDECPVICACHELKLAATSDFFETEDMTADHQEYEPRFVDGEFTHGDL